MFQIIDLGLAVIAPLGSVGVRKITQLVGTMAYISPEQTGRVSRSIDYRTDLYSLGVVLYQLATGCLPFSTDDSLEFLHMIIAKAPIPPHVIKPSLPLVVSNIIVKLLSKNADERYQSAWGVRADLARVLQLCLQQRGVEVHSAIPVLPSMSPVAGSQGSRTPSSELMSGNNSPSPPSSRCGSAAHSTNPYISDRQTSYSSVIDFGAAIASNATRSSLFDEPDQVQAIMDEDLVRNQRQDSEEADDSKASFAYDIPVFPLAVHDIVSRLNIPQKLFGREKECTELLSSIDELFATGRTSVVCVTGPSGSGKTSLVRSILDTLQDRRTLFASARCEQVNRMPYDCLIQLVNEVVLKILSRPSPKVRAWKERLLSALSTNASLIIGICTTLESILGPQPPVPYLQAAEAVHRLHLTFVKFLCAFATKRKPLVLMIDNLQWADSASLKMIQLFVSDAACANVLCVLSYRDTSMTAEHRVMQTMQNIAANGVALRTIPMLPLPLSQVNALICETLGCAPERSLPLSSIVLTKSDGNPFAVTQLILSLHADKLLYFSIDPSQPDAKGQWYWSEEALQSRELTADVPQLVLKKVQALPSMSQKVLKFAACIDGKFDADLLCAISRLSRQQVTQALSEPIKQELILLVRDTAAPVKAGLLAEAKAVEAVDDEAAKKAKPKRKKKRSKDEGKAGDELSSDDSEEEGGVEASGSSSKPLSLAAAARAAKQAALFGERLACYQFLHDRVQQACYSLMEEREQAQTHLHIARHLYAQYQQDVKAAAQSSPSQSPTSGSLSGPITPPQTPPLVSQNPSSFAFGAVPPVRSGPSARESSAKLDELLWAVVHHYSLSIDALDPNDDTEERLLIARLNLKAGKKAKLSGSLQQALLIVKSGMHTLGFVDHAEDKQQQQQQGEAGEPQQPSPRPTAAEGDSGEQTLASPKSGGGGYSTTHPQRVSPIVVGRQLAGRTAAQAEHRGAKEESEMWDLQYEVVFGLFLERADCEHLLGNAVAAEHYLQVAVEHAKTDEDTLLVLHRLIIQQTNVGNFAAALRYGRRCLIILDVPFPLVSPQPPPSTRPALLNAPGVFTSVPFAPATASALISASAATISSSAGYQVPESVHSTAAATRTRSHTRLA